MFFGNLPQFGKKVKVGVRSSSVTRSQINEMSNQWRVSLYMVMSQNVMSNLGEGYLIMFDEIKIGLA